MNRIILTFAGRLLDFAVEEARVWGWMAREFMNSCADPMIAATALRHGAVVVSNKMDVIRPTGVRSQIPF